MTAADVRRGRRTASRIMYVQPRSECITRRLAGSEMAPLFSMMIRLNVRHALQAEFQLPFPAASMTASAVLSNQMAEIRLSYIIYAWRSLSLRLSPHCLGEKRRERVFVGTRRGCATRWVLWQTRRHRLVHKPCGRSRHLPSKHRGWGMNKSQSHLSEGDSLCVVD